MGPEHDIDFADLNEARSTHGLDLVGDLIDEDLSANLFESDVDDLFEDEDLDEELVELDDDVGLEPSGRVPRAQRARRVLLGTATNRESFGAGYDEGVLAAAEEFGGIGVLAGWAAKKALPALVRGGRSRLSRRDGGIQDAQERGSGSAAQGQNQGARLRAIGEAGGGFFSAFREGAGQEWEPLVGRIGRRAGEFMAARREGDAQDRSVEAEAEELPPVYVADEITATELLDEGDTLVSLEPMSVSDRFGEGHLRAKESFGRVATERAIGRAARYGSTHMQRTNPSPARPFVEDDEAEPVLFDDGMIVEPAYGRLQMVPCPSCANSTEGHEDCVICDEHSAILVPEKDVSSLVGARTVYGVLVTPTRFGFQIRTRRQVDEAKAKKLKKRQRKKAKKLAEKQAALAEKQDALAKKQAAKAEKQAEKHARKQAALEDRIAELEKPGEVGSAFEGEEDFEDFEDVDLEDFEEAPGPFDEDLSVLEEEAFPEYGEVLSDLYELEEETEAFGADDDNDESPVRVLAPSSWLRR